jgi:hypothetical protein
MFLPPNSLRFSGDISDVVYGPYQSFKLYLKNLHLSNEMYIYSWTARKLFSLSDYRQKGDAKFQQEVEKFIQEVIQNLNELVNFLNAFLISC